MDKTQTKPRRNLDIDIDKDNDIDNDIDIERYIMSRHNIFGVLSALKALVGWLRTLLRLANGYRGH
jgi:hypothetical protein